MMAKFIVLYWPNWSVLAKFVTHDLEHFCLIITVLLKVD